MRITTILTLLAVALPLGDAWGRELLMDVFPTYPSWSSRPSQEDNISPSIPEFDITIARQATGFEPEQIHLTYWGTPSKMVVSFASGFGAIVLGKPPHLPKPSETSVVQFGTQSGKLDRQTDCHTTSYVQDQSHIRNYPGYISPYLSHCLMSDLPAGTHIYYRVGWPDFEKWSPEFNFTTFKEHSNFPLKIGVVADLGLSYNASTTVDGMSYSKPDVILNVGDLPYADVFLPWGTQGGIPDYFYELSYQPRWDMYGRLMQNLSASVPMMTSSGNHEVEFQAGGVVFAAYNMRYPVPQDPSKPPEPVLNRFSQENPSPDRGLYYSWDVPGAAHFVALTSYIPNDTFSAESAQYKWLEADLKKVDRSKTPWLILYFHAPMVNSFRASFKQVECMRLTYEPLFYKYGVDIILNGHVHAYERSWPVYNYTLDPCGPIHITVGCGGKQGEAGTGLKALDTKFIEEGAPWCDDPKLLDLKPNKVQPRRCHTFQPDLGGFCWKKQPPFSAFRQSAFGWSRLRLINETHAEWKWHRNVKPDEADVDGGNPLSVVDDWMILNRAEPAHCINRLGGGRMPTAPKPPAAGAQTASGSSKTSISMSSGGG